MSRVYTLSEFAPKAPIASMIRFTHKSSNTFSGVSAARRHSIRAMCLRWRSADAVCWARAAQNAHLRC